jgi:hypothetical protein
MSKSTASKSAKSTKKSTKKSKAVEIGTVKLTPAEKRKATIAAKKLAAAQAQAQVSADIQTAIDAQDLSELSEVEAVTLTQEISDEVNGTPTATDLEPSSAKKGSAEWAALEAKTILGEDAIVWSAMHDAKGKEFTSPRFRVGMPSDKDTGYLIESGRLIIGAGNSYAEAVRDARKRTAGHLGPVSPAEKVAAEYVADGNVAPEDEATFAAEVAEELAASIE